LEKAAGREASIKDLAICEAAVRRLHSLGLTHEDLNRFDFIVGEGGVKSIDFENSKVGKNVELM
jgi:tRNA A-37 threonylcarbamoyl transferase component Bud32